jgi:hypothetical protein
MALRFVCIPYLTKEKALSTRGTFGGGRCRTSFNFTQSFYLAEVLEVSPDYEYKIRYQTETQTGYEQKEKVVWQRYLATLSRFMSLVGIGPRPGF